MKIHIIISYVSILNPNERHDTLPAIFRLCETPTHRSYLYCRIWVKLLIVLTFQYLTV